METFAATVTDSDRASFKPAMSNALGRKVR